MIVFLDTNVIVGVSIFLKILGVRIEHPLYQHSIHIMRKLENSNSLYLSTTVQDETFDVLAKAVDYEISRTNAAFDFDTKSEILMICVKNAESVISKMNISEAVPADQTIQQVEQMCADLVRKYRNKYGDIQKLQVAAKRKMDQVNAGKWGWLLRKTVYSVHFNQLAHESVQLKHFARNEQAGRNYTDKRILEDCIELKKSHSGNFYVGSNDKKFFSPFDTKHVRQSRLVTDEIFERFGIACYSPKDFLAKLQSESK